MVRLMDAALATRPLDWRGDFPAIPEGWAYLDSAATAQKPKAVIDAIMRGYSETYATVHRGVYQRSAEMTLAFEASRRRVAEFIGAASPEEIVFVRGATEGINLVAHSWLKPGDRILLSTLEHHSNIVPWQLAGAEIDVVPLTADHRIDLDAMAAMIRPEHKLVALAHVSNVLGSVLDAKRAAAIAHSVGAKLLLDGCQAVPRMPVDVADLDCDFYVFSGHKLYGPTGIGALWGRLDLLRAMPPFLGGGSMIRKVTKQGTTYADVPARFEAGTPAIAQAIGMASALRWLDGLGMDVVLEHERQITGYALERLPEVPGLRIFGPPRGDERIGPVSFELEGVHAHDISEILDRHGVAVRAGHHCAQILMDRLGVSATARASFGVYTTPAEIDRLVDGLHDARKVFGLTG
jgi:cysteine desulfurase/selenocysteine lyase